MLIFTSIYCIVDGYFVSNFVGKTPFAAINFIYPFLSILSSIGFMFGTGGSALIAKTVGEGKNDRANSIFSMIVLSSIICGLVLTGIGFVLLEPVAKMLGAEGQLLEDSLLYGRIYLISLTGCVLQFEFESLCSAAEKPKLGLYSTVAAGIINIVLDALFVAVFPFGLAGAAVATTISQITGGIIPLFCFGKKSKGLLKFVKPKFCFSDMKRICSNGFSELLNNISMSIVSVLYNWQLLKYAGEYGIAAYGVIMYVTLIFLAVFIGYSVGLAPVISYHYGAQNHKELKSILRKSLVIIGTGSLIMFGLSEMSAYPLSVIFVNYDRTLFDITKRAFLIYSFSYLFSGFAIFGSAFFTALNNGRISAAISFLRTIVFQVAAVILLPLIWDTDGIWVSVTVAEALAAFLSLILIYAKRKSYHYM